MQSSDKWVNHMLRFARFAFVAGLAAAIPALSGFDSAQQPAKQPTSDKKKAEPAKKDNVAKDSDERIDRRNARMKERNQEIDRRLNQPKK